MFHREDGPAIILDDREVWMKFGKKHREDGPAVFYYPDSNKNEWWNDGKLHRLDGPAKININGFKEYWVAGKKTLSKKEFDSRVKLFIFD